MEIDIPTARETDIPPPAPHMRRARSSHSEHYFDQTEGLPEATRISINLERLRNLASDCGYQSLFDVAIAEARHNPTAARQFVQGDGLTTIYSAFETHISPRNAPEVQTAIANTLGGFIRREWIQLMKDGTFKIPLSSFGPDAVRSFSFEGLYQRLQTNAPTWMVLLESLLFKDIDQSEVEHRARRRRIVVCTCMLANKKSREFNVLQGMVGYMLYASKVPKRVLTDLNHLGVCSSYVNITAAVRSSARALTSTMKSMCSTGEALWVSFDNLSFKAGVRDMGLTNRGDTIIQTAGYIVRPYRKHQMFKRDDRNYHLAPTLTASDFVPSVDDAAQMEVAFRSMIADAIKEFFARQNIKITNLDFHMPEIYPLDHRERSEIFTLPVYPHNEGVVNEMIKILEKIGADIGISEDQVKENIINFKGDFLTRRCSPEKRLDYVEATTGLFHLQIQALAMLFQAHMGQSSDTASLARWMGYFRSMKQVLWTGGKNPMKDFRSCQRFWDFVLDGYIIAAITTRCGFTTIDKFISDWDKAEVSTAINALAKELSSFSEVARMRALPDETRDRDHENHLLLLQHGLVLRNFVLAMRQGDSGRVRISLSYLTVWFQATKKHNYASETIHLTACLKRLWSDEMKQYWMENCLINPSGKVEGFMACDFLGEYVVREVKRMMLHNLTDVTARWLYQFIAVQILLFREVRKKMAEECDSPTGGMHSSSVSTQAEVENIAQQLLRDGVTEQKPGRGEIDGLESEDLHGAGLTALGTTVRIHKYIERLERDNGWVNVDLEETEDVEVEDEDLLGDDSEDEWFAA